MFDRFRLNKQRSEARALSPIFKNLGNGKFVTANKQIGLKNYGFGMGTAVADFDHDGLIDIAMTNVDFNPSQRMNLKIFNKGIVLYKNSGSGKFTEVKNAGLDWVGLGAGGVEFIDFDNDGWSDLYVTNGLWSGTQRDEDLSSYFVRAFVAQLSFAGPTLDHGQSAYMKLLKEHRGPLADTKTKTGTLSMAGYQHKRLFRNNRNGTFTEIGFVAGVDSLADGYVVAKADLNKDGKMDLILRNADPGTMVHTFPPVQVYLNETPVTAESLVIKLIGRKSNKEGVGAKVNVTLGSKKYTQELVANNGAAQGEKVLHFGLGEAKKADIVQVNWPSGHVNVLKNVAAGFLEIKETETASGTLK